MKKSRKRRKTTPLPNFLLIPLEKSSCLCREIFLLLLLLFCELNLENVHVNMCVKDIKGWWKARKCVEWGEWEKRGDNDDD